MKKIIKRSGEEQVFDSRKIRNAIRKANATVSKIDELTDAQMDRITEYVTAACEVYDRPVGVEEIQDIVEKQLMAMGAFDVAKNYVVYRKKRERTRNIIKIRTGSATKGDITDQSLLLVNSMTEGQVTQWDRTKIIDRIVSAINLDRDKAAEIAKDVESQLISSGLIHVSTALIRELVNNAIVDHGFSGELQDLTMYRIPRDFVESLLHAKSDENSNVVNNNPEAVNLAIAELVLKQWALDAIFSDDVKAAHDTGAVHLHDLGYPTRVYCSSHSVEYIKKYGLKGLNNLNTTSKPAKSASVLTGHLNTFLASMQANYAGALGIAYINVLYAPYLRGMSDKELHQVAQELIFNGSQNAFSRGGQTLFLDFNIHTGVPKYLKNVPAVGPGGKYMFIRPGLENVHSELEEETIDGNWCLVYPGSADGNIPRTVVLKEHDGKQEFVSTDIGRVLTYGDFEDETRRFCSALLKVWGEGDAFGHVFEFPKLDFHVSADTFTDPEQNKLFQEACRVSSHNGSTYFVFDRDDVTLSACCRLRTTIEDKSVLLHPERLRFCGFQNVTINIPQCAYRAARRKVGNIDTSEWDLFLEEIDNTMDIAVKAHLQKKKATQSIMNKPGDALWQIGKEANDGRPYIKLDDCTYIIGLIGVNDALQYMTGKQMHEDDKVMEMALHLASYMYLRAKGYTKQYGLKFNLEESPAESAARRLAKADLMYYREDALKVYKGGSEDVAYYTNSVHLTADAPVSLVERIRKQSMFHSAIESGAIIHAFLGEEQPGPEALGEMVRGVFLRTQAAQLTFSPEFTYCLECGKSQRGLKEACDSCGSQNVVGETRVVGYFSRIQNWNKSKRYGELVARHQGDYNVCTAEDEDQEVENA